MKELIEKWAKEHADSRVHAAEWDGFTHGAERMNQWWAERWSALFEAIGWTFNSEVGPKTQEIINEMNAAAKGDR